MQSFESYCKISYGLVSRWWKYALVALLIIDAILITTLAGCYDGIGELNEWYFSFGNKIMYVGVFEK